MEERLYMPLLALKTEGTRDQRKGLVLRNLEQTPNKNQPGNQDVSHTAALG